MDEADAVLGQYLRGQLLVMVILAGVLQCRPGVIWIGAGFADWNIYRFGIFVPYVGLVSVWCWPHWPECLNSPVRSGHGPCPADGGRGVWVRTTGGRLLFDTPSGGERIGLHPLAVIFALLAFGQIFGFVGVLIALPVSAVLLVAMRRIKARYMASPLYKG
jgi:predicted PurR-regulated permease PerM